MCECVHEWFSYLSLRQTGNLGAPAPLMNPLGISVPENGWMDNFKLIQIPYLGVFFFFLNLYPFYVFDSHIASVSSPNPLHCNDIKQSPCILKTYIRPLLSSRLRSHGVSFKFKVTFNPLDYILYQITTVCLVSEVSCEFSCLTTYFSLVSSCFQSLDENALKRSFKRLMLTSEVTLGSFTNNQIKLYIFKEMSHSVLTSSQI